MIRIDRNGSTILISVIRWIKPSINPPYQVPTAAMIMVRIEVPRAASRPNVKAIGMPHNKGNYRSRLR